MMQRLKYHCNPSTSYHRCSSRTVQVYVRYH